MVSLSFCGTVPQVDGAYPPDPQTRSALHILSNNLPLYRTQLITFHHYRESCEEHRPGSQIPFHDRPLLKLIPCQAGSLPKR